MRRGSLTIGGLMDTFNSNLNRLSSKEGYIQLGVLSEESDSFENDEENVIYENTFNSRLK